MVKIVQILKSYIIIQDETDKQIEDCKKYDIIGIMSGASTPIETVQKIVEKINSLCEVENEL